MIEELGKLGRILDARQRCYALARRLCGLEVDSVMDCIRMICDGTILGNVELGNLYNSMIMSSFLWENLGNEKISLLTAAAQDRGEYDIVAVFMDVESGANSDIPFQPYLDPALKETPLGVRKSLARTPDFKTIMRVAKDQDHRVIRNLLDNPRLTERDVITIGAARPTSPKVIETIYYHQRWISRYSVKKVIVFNPYSPLSMAIRLSLFLNYQDLETMLNFSDLNPILLAQAKKTLDKKSLTNMEMFDVS